MTTTQQVCLTFTTDDEIDAETLHALVLEALREMRHSGMPIAMTPEGEEVWIDTIDGEPDPSEED